MFLCGGKGNCKGVEGEEARLDELGGGGLNNEYITDDDVSSPDAGPWDEMASTISRVLIRKSHLLKRFFGLFLMIFPSLLDSDDDVDVSALLFRSIS
jgi:hypothetical protein